MRLQFAMGPHFLNATLDFAYSGMLKTRLQALYIYYLVRHFQPEQASPTHQPPSLKSLISILTLQAFVSNLNPHPHPPSLISTLTLHLSNLKPSPSPSISNLNFTLSNLNPRPSSLHLRSHPHPPSPILSLALQASISNLNPHPYPPSLRSQALTPHHHRTGKVHVYSLSLSLIL